MHDGEGRLPWEDDRCGHDVDGARCRGVAVGADSACVVHTSAEERERVLTGVTRGEDVAFTRGISISGDLLDEILARATAPGAEGPVLTRADFTGATFTDIVKFEHTTFVGGATFAGTTFEHALFVVDCRFHGDAYFSRAHFRSNAFFVGARFEQATFERVWFEHGADFSSSEFDSIGLYGTRSADALSFPGAVFHGEASIGPVLSESTVRLDGATFDGVTIVEVVARELTCMATTFSAATLIRARRAMIVLDHAVFREPSTLAGNVGPFERAWADLDEGELFDEGRLKRFGLGERPSLISLALVDASRLSLSGIDLSACLFRRAHNLDRLRIEGSRSFDRTPPGVRLAWAWPPVRWWTRRRVVADESLWRAYTDGDSDEARQAAGATRGASWRVPDMLDMLSDRSSEFVSTAPASDAESIAQIYRSLRKADEDARNEPAAADFYYGEMEMRRADRDSPRAERVLLFLYWLVSGYGLRASRAVTALIVTVLAFAVGFRWWGFATSDTFTQAVLYSANSTVSLLRAPVRDLTTAGQVMDIALRLLGPLFFGLILVSLRGRVKR